MNAKQSIDDVMLFWEDQRHQGRDVAAEELCRECPELLSQVRAEIDALRAMDAAYGLESNGEAATIAKAPAGDRTITAARFRSVRFHARGGLGEIYIAEDAELSRQVALKCMQPLQAQCPESRRRFLREAEITAQIEHPGVVPVHGLVRDDAGQPCYAMRFIHGESFQQAIDRHHGTASGTHHDARERRHAFRQLLGAFVAVCNTIAYSHSRGFIHRDLKPANVMTGAFGETLVLDWGLAREIRSQESGVRDQESGVRNQESGVRNQESGVSGRQMESSRPDFNTMTGDAIGTPAFMSPEQAAGRQADIGPASDIYSLGAMLYGILTGHKPHEEANPAVVIERVARGELRRPSQVGRDVPPALESICLKAMALRPAERYASARDVALEIEHWLADEPVGVYRDPWSVRTLRWMRRHRTLVTSSAAALVASLLILSGATWLLARANDRERAEKDRAETSFLQARAAVDEYFSLISQEKLTRFPGAQPLRKELLQAALRYYQDFLKQRGDDPALEAQVALTATRVGQILGDIESVAAARPWYDDGLRRWRALVAREPGVAAHGRGLAEQLDLLATDERRAGKQTAALPLVTEAVALLESLHEAHADDVAAARLLGRAYVNLSATLGSLARQEESLAIAAKGIEHRLRLAQMQPDDLPLRVHNVVATINLGVDLLELERLEEAAATFHQAIGQAEDLAQAAPASKRDHTVGAEVRDHHATARLNLARTLHLADKAADALPHFDQAGKLWEQLRADNPTVKVYPRQLLWLYTFRGDAFRALHRSHEALNDYRAGQKLADDLLKGAPDDVWVLNRLGASWDGAAAVLAESDRDRANDAFAKADEAHRRAFATSPEVFEIRFYLGEHHRLRAAAQRSWKQPREALAASTAHQALWPTNARELFKAAGDAALSMPLFTNQADREQAGVQALTLLQRCRELGLFEIPAYRRRLEGDANLAVIRERPEFAKLRP